ncbi:MAG: hypothetical protein MZU91_07915 [Desulfosudis oleivorans]|nr:hypothetical protein [Desulfosudis oleivorans]
MHGGADALEDFDLTGRREAGDPDRRHRLDREARRPAHRPRSANGLKAGGTPTSGRPAVHGHRAPAAFFTSNDPAANANRPGVRGAATPGRPLPDNLSLHGFRSIIER